MTKGGFAVGATGRKVKRIHQRRWKTMGTSAQAVGTVDVGRQRVYASMVLDIGCMWKELQPHVVVWDEMYNRASMMLNKLQWLSV